MALCLSFIIFFVMRLALIFFSHKYRAKRRIIKSREYEETFLANKVYHPRPKACAKYLKVKLLI